MFPDERQVFSLPYKLYHQTALHEYKAKQFLRNLPFFFNTFCFVQT